MPSFYDELRQKSHEIERYISSLPILRDIFTSGYFQKVRKQIDEMEKTNQIGPLHSMFIFMLDDSRHGLSQTKMLKEYLTKIFEHPNTKPKTKNHIKAQLVSEQHVFMLFEVSILGNLLSQLPGKAIKLYPRTVRTRAVEAEIVLVDRPVHIETTVLGESRGDKNTFERMMRVGRHTWGGSRDLNHDSERFAKKLLEKSKQFLPDYPNVLAISLFDFWPAHLQVMRAIRSNSFPNIGLIMQFGRGDLEHSFEENCDPSCALTEEEGDRLTKLLSGENYHPLVYGVPGR